MNELIIFLYNLDLGWLGMASLVVVFVILLIVAFLEVASQFIKSEEEIIDDWRKLGERR